MAEAQALAEVMMCKAAAVAERTDEAAEDNPEAEAMHEAAKAPVPERAGAEASEETTDAVAKAICAGVDAEATMTEALYAGSEATAVGLDDKFAAELQSRRSNVGRDDRSVVCGAVIY